MKIEVLGVLSATILGGAFASALSDPISQVATLGIGTFLVGWLTLRYIPQQAKINADERAADRAKQGDLHSEYLDTIHKIQNSLHRYLEKVEEAREAERTAAEATADRMLTYFREEFQREQDLRQAQSTVLQKMATELALLRKDFESSPPSLGPPSSS